MTIARLFGLFALIVGVVGGSSGAGMTDEPSPHQPRREEYQKAYQNRNYKDAYEGFRQLALDPTDTPDRVGDDLSMAIACLQQLNRVSEIDAFREAVIKVHPNNWRLLWVAARTYMDGPHHGFMVAGQFERGDKRGGGQVANAVQRDRVRSLQLMTQAMPLAQQDPQRHEAGRFFESFATMLLGQGEFEYQAWRLQYLTDLDTLPDYHTGWGGYQDEPAGAPVGENDQPVYHTVPKSFAAATSVEYVVASSRASQA